MVALQLWCSRLSMEILRQQAAISMCTTQAPSTLLCLCHWGTTFPAALSVVRFNAKWILIALVHSIQSHTCPEANQICDYQKYSDRQMVHMPNAHGVDTPFPPLCSAGFVGDSNLTTSQMYATCARSCPAGHFCQEGTVVPTPCPAGSASQAGAQSSAACESCAPGLYASANGTAVCTPCKGGTYSAHRGSSACEMCTPSYVCVEGSSAPAPCPGGTHANVSLPSLTSLDQCLVCPAGTSCPVGSSTPVSCTPGTFSAQSHSPACQPCTSGTFQSNTGGTACKLCTTSHYCPEGSGRPTPCPPGTVGRTTGLNESSQCSLCPAGHWCNSGLAFGCSPGYFTASDHASMARTDLSACLPCPLHATTHAGGSATAAACVCDATYYNDVTDASLAMDAKNATCKTCPTGTVCDTRGTTLTTLPVNQSFWKPGYLSVDAKPCPHPSTWQLSRSHVQCHRECHMCARPRTNRRLLHALRG